MQIICPVCHQKLKRLSKTYVCENHHSFDISRYGYVNLSRRKTKSGDNATLTEARTHFLQAGYYHFLKNEMLQIFQETGAHEMVDLACGDGYYTADFPLPHLGIDLSQSALRTATRNDPRGEYLLASIFDIPLADSSCEFMLTCFAPVAIHEIERCLKKKAYFLLVLPDTDHLFELKQQLYNNVRLNPQEDLSFTGFHLLKEKRIRSGEVLPQGVLRNLLYMTPYAYRTKKEALQYFASIPSLYVRFSFRLLLWQKN